MKTLHNLLCLLCALFALRAATGAVTAIAAAEPYGSHRTAALSGFDLEGVPSEIDRRLDPKAAVSLGTTITSTGEFGAAFWYTATYALYPRRVTPSSTHRLEIGASAPGATVGSIDELGPLKLVGPMDEKPGAAGRAASEFDFASLLFASATIVGMGFAGAMLVRRHVESVTWLDVLLSGVLVNAVVAHVATWIQVGVAPRFLGLAGTGLCVAQLLRAATLRGRNAMPSPSFRQPWMIFPVAVATLAIASAAIFPVVDWDGRYVWLFHGKQLFFRGFIPLEESRALDNLQPTYPLLTPALFATGSALRESFNERTAVVLQTLLHSAVLAGLATSAARSLGARSASLLSALVATMVFGWTAQAYADGLLATLLLLEFLELREGDHRASGWLAAACAALTKREGLVLALIVALLVRGWRAWRPLTFSLLPGFVHAVWNGVAGLRHELDSPRFVLSDLPVRLAEIAYRSAAITWHSSTYLLVACGLVVILWTARRRTLPSLTRDAVVVALATSVFILLTFLVTPKPLTWHLNTALPRLALHPAVFGVVAIFALTTPRRNPDPA